MFSKYIANLVNHSNVRIFYRKMERKKLQKDDETLMGLKCILVLSVATCHWNVIPLNLSS